MNPGRAILATLYYSDYFSYPLTFSELHSRLISSKLYREEQIRRSLHLLLSSHRLALTDGYYHLPGKSSLVAKRLHRQALSLPLQKRARALALQLGRLPGVLAIYLTGSLAMSNADSFSDLDLMIIAKNKRLWSTRFLLTLYTELLGFRRHPRSSNSKINSGKLCLNLYLTPRAFLLPSTKRTLYTAYELIQAIPLFDPHDTHPFLLSANSWLHSLLPNYILPKLTKVKSRKDTKLASISAVRRPDLLSRSQACRGMFSRILSLSKERPGQILMDCIELLCYRLQLLYMHRKLTREYITPNSAFFHPHDPGEKILKKINQLSH